MYFTVAPVWSSQGLTIARNASCSDPPQVPMTVTYWPVRSVPGADASGLDGAIDSAGMLAAGWVTVGVAVGVDDPVQAAATSASAAIADAVRIPMPCACLITVVLLQLRAR